MNLLLIALTAVLVISSQGAKIYIEELEPKPKDEPKYAFSVQLKTAQSATASDEIVKFDTILRNDEWVFNPETWVFKAPVKGVYRFYYSGVSKDGAAQLDLYSPSAGPVARGWAGASDQQMSNMVIAQLDQGDSVWVRIVGSTHKLKGCDPACSTFSGQLIYKSE